MQYLERGELETIAAVFHQMSQKELPIALGAAGLPQLSLLLLQAKPYAERLFQYNHIGSLNKLDARKALEIPAQQKGVVYEQKALEMIIECSEGYPYFIQQWGEQVWRIAEKSPITFDDAQAAEEAVQEELDARFFQDRFNKASDLEKDYMAAMASLENEPYSTGEIVNQLGLTDTRKASKRRDNLVKKGLIYSPSYGKLAFTVPHFAQYVQRVHMSAS
jgi:hypothetical protein